MLFEHEENSIEQELWRLGDAAHKTYPERPISVMTYTLLISEAASDQRCCRWPNVKWDMIESIFVGTRSDHSLAHVIGLASQTEEIDGCQAGHDSSHTQQELRLELAESPPQKCSAAWRLAGRIRPIGPWPR